MGGQTCYLDVTVIDQLIDLTAVKDVIVLAVVVTSKPSSVIECVTVLNHWESTP